MKTPNVTDLKRIAEVAGEMALSHFKINAPYYHKADKTIVTHGDIETNKLVVDMMEREFPDVYVIGEEGVGGDPRRRSNWVLLFDPVDGTRFYGAGFPGWGMGFALMHNLEPVVAVIHDPIHHGTWSAVRGVGAFQNGESVRITYSGDLPGSTVSLVKWKGCPYKMEAVKETIEEFGVKVLDPPSVVMAGGVLASGGIHASVFPGAAAWETAAIQLIVEEAGGWAADMYGRHPIPYRWTNDGLVIMDGHIIAANRGLAETIAAIARRCNAPERCFTG